MYHKRYRSNRVSMKDIKMYKNIFNKRLYHNRRFLYLLRTVLLFFWVIFTKHAMAQGVDEFTESLHKKRSFYFAWDSKATFITNSYAQVKSVKLGLDFGGKTKFGIGYNWYKGNIVRTVESGDAIAKANLKFRYVSLFTEYVYFLNKHWEATIPAQLGMGLHQYQKEFSKDIIPKTGGLFLIYEPSSTIMYRFLRYFGVGLGIGYRIVLLTGSNPLNERFSSPVLSFRTKIYFEYVWEDCKKLF